MTQKTGNNKGLLQKIESIAKIIGGLSIPIVGALVSVVLHMNAEENRKVQLFAEILSKRESADSSIRASMFNTLMDQYLGVLTVDRSSDTVDNLRNQVVFLNLLINNFQEYFNSRPLFEDLYDRIKKLKEKQTAPEEIKKLENLREEIIDISQSTAKKQEVMLSRIGVTKDVFVKVMEHKCVLLYDPGNDLKIEGENGNLMDMQLEMVGKCDFLGEGVKLSKEKINELKGNDRRFFAIQIKPIGIHDHEIKIEMAAFQDFFEDNILVKREKVKSIQFGVSYFDLPYMDNTRLFDGSRFAIVLRSIFSKQWVELGIISFREEFMSLRDRPFIEDMLNKLHEGEPET